MGAERVVEIYPVTTSPFAPIIRATQTVRLVDSSRTDLNLLKALM